MNDAERYPCATCKYKGNSIIVAMFLGGAGSQTCYRPNRPADPITGNPEWTTCEAERIFPCGYEGKYHSKRETLKK